MVKLFRLIFKNGFACATRHNFIRAGNFFLSAISTAFLAEVATLYVLGVGNLNDPMQPTRRSP
jgi:hypothetical protein